MTAPPEGAPRVALSISSFGDASDEPLERLNAAGVVVVPNPKGGKLSADEVATLLSDCDATIAGTEPLTDAIFDVAPRLRVISRVGIGLDNVDLDAAERRGIAVLNTPDAVTDPVAELTVGGMLGVLRHIARMDRELREGRWTRLMGGLLRERTVGIVGFGRVGRRVAELLTPFGCRLIACDSRPVDDAARERGVEVRGHDDVIAGSDIVTLHCAAEHCVLGAEQIASMRRGAILVNTSRGSLVDEDALHAALEGGHLAGAYVDVFAREPYDGPLRELDTALLTPHAGSFAAEARAQMEIEAVENLLASLKVAVS